MLKFILVILLSIPLLSFYVDNPYYTLKVKIENIRNTNGRIQLQVYKDTESFKKETPYTIKLITKGENVKNNTLYYEFKLPKGKYGLALLDDENKNTKMDYGIVWPKEGFGFSNYYHTAWTKPTFNDFSFDLTNDIDIKIKIRYV